MCVVSMIIDHGKDKWKNPWDYPYVNNPNLPSNLPSQQELDEFRELLRKAREYDKKNNEPECESDEKIAALKKILLAMEQRAKEETDKKILDALEKLAEELGISLK